MAHPYGGNNRLRPNSPRGRFVPTNHQLRGRTRWSYTRRSAPYWLLTSQLRKNTQKPKSNLGIYLALITGVVMIGVLLFSISTPALAGFFGYNYYSQQYPVLKDYSSVNFEVSHIYDRNGQLIYQKNPAQGKRDVILYKDIPQTLIDATTSAEDPTFFSNSGFDIYAIIRALYINVSGSGSSGASTITQQVARLVYLPPDQRYNDTIDRKLRELAIAIKLSQQDSKQDIMQKYLNTIYYGDSNYGIEAAAEGYFGKKAKDLNLAEASMLAGLPQLPSVYDPNTNYDLAKARQHEVLNLMVKNNKITQYQADQAYFNFDIKSDLVNGNHSSDFVDSRVLHFVNYVIDQLSGQVASPQLQEAGLTFSPDDWNQGGYDVYTTIDPAMEAEAEKVAQAHVKDLASQNATNAALVSIDPHNGEILAMMGSLDYNNKKIDGQFNVTLAQRQPGSAIKPVTYSLALTDGWTPATILTDVSQQFPTGTAGQVWVPHDYDYQQRGPVSLRDALGSSLNIPAVETMKFVGVQNMMDLASQMGISYKNSASFYGLPLTLGSGEVPLLDLTGAYSVFDNLGVHIPPVSILQIKRHQRIIYQYDINKVNKPKVLDSSVAYMITNILSDNSARLLTFAPDNPLVLDRPAAAKTGTTTDFKDSLTVGYTPDLVTGVWVGNSDDTPMKEVAGALGAGNIWHDFMEGVYHDPNLSKDLGTPGQPLQTDFYQPNDIVQAKICSDSGLLPNDACPPESIKTEIFAKGHAPTTQSQLEQKIRVSKYQNCLAGDDYPESDVAYRVIYNYPPELQAWAQKNNKPTTLPPYCPPFEPPTVPRIFNPLPSSSATATTPSFGGPPPDTTTVGPGNPPVQTTTTAPAAPVQTTTAPPPVTTTPPPPAGH